MLEGCYFESHDHHDHLYCHFLDMYTFQVLFHRRASLYGNGNQETGLRSSNSQSMILIQNLEFQPLTQTTSSASELSQLASHSSFAPNSDNAG